MRDEPPLMPSRQPPPRYLKIALFATTIGISIVVAVFVGDGPRAWYLPGFVLTLIGALIFETTHRLWGRP